MHTQCKNLVKSRQQKPQTNVARNRMWPWARDKAPWTVDSGQHVQMRMRNYWNKLITADCAWRCHACSTATPDSDSDSDYISDSNSNSSAGDCCLSRSRELIYARPHSDLVGGILLWCRQDPKSKQLQPVVEVGAGAGAGAELGQRDQSVKWLVAVEWSHTNCLMPFDPNRKISA